MNKMNLFIFLFFFCTSIRAISAQDSVVGNIRFRLIYRARNELNSNNLQINVCSLNTINTTFVAEELLITTPSKIVYWYADDPEQNTSTFFMWIEHFSKSQLHLIRKCKLVSIDYNQEIEEILKTPKYSTMCSIATGDGSSRSCCKLNESNCCYKPIPKRLRRRLKRSNTDPEPMELEDCQNRNKREMGEILEFLTNFIESSEKSVPENKEVAKIVNSYSMREDASQACKEIANFPSNSLISGPKINYLVVSKTPTFAIYVGEGGSERPHTHINVAYQLIELQKKYKNFKIEFKNEGGRKLERMVETLKKNEELFVIKYKVGASKCLVQLIEAATYALFNEAGKSKFNLMNDLVPLPKLRYQISKEYFHKLQLYAADNILKTNKYESYSIIELKRFYSDEIIGELYNEISKVYSFPIKAIDIERFTNIQRFQSYDSFNPLNRAVSFKILQLVKQQRSVYKANEDKVEKGTHIFHAKLYNKYKDPDSEVIENVQFSGFYNRHRKYKDEYIEQQYMQLSTDLIRQIEAAFEERSKKEIIKSYLKMVFCVQVLTGSDQGRKVKQGNQYQDGYLTLFVTFMNNLLDSGRIDKEFRWYKSKQTASYYTELKAFFGTHDSLSRYKFGQETCYLTGTDKKTLSEAEKDRDDLFNEAVNLDFDGSLLVGLANELKDKIKDEDIFVLDPHSKNVIIKNYLKMVFCVQILTGLDQGRKIKGGNDVQDGYHKQFATFMNNLLDSGRIDEEFRWNKLEQTASYYAELTDFFGSSSKQNRVGLDNCHLKEPIKKTLSEAEKDRDDLFNEAINLDLDESLLNGLANELEAKVTDEDIFVADPYSKKSIAKSYLQQVFCVRILTGLEGKRVLNKGSRGKFGYASLFAIFMNNLVDRLTIDDKFKWNKYKLTGTSYEEMKTFFNGRSKKVLKPGGENTCFLEGPHVKTRSKAEADRDKFGNEARKLGVEERTLINLKDELATGITNEQIFK